MKKMNKLVKSTSVYVITSLILNGINVLAAPIFTRLLSTADYGIVSNFTTWTSIMNAVLGLGLSYTIGNAKIDFENRLDEYIGNIISLVTLVTLILILTLPLSVAMWSSVTFMSRELVFIIFPYILCNVNFGIVQVRYIFESKYIKNALITIIPVLISVIVSVILIVRTDIYPYLGRVLGNCIPVIIVGFGYGIWYIKKSNPSAFISDCRYALKISLPMIPHGLAMIVLGQIDRVMIIKYYGNSEAGIYSLGYTVGMLISIIAIAMGRATQPWIYRKYNERDYKSIKKLEHDILTIMATGIVVYCLVVPEILHILADKKFWNSIDVIYPVAVAAFCQFVYSLYSNIETYHKKTVIIGTSSAIAAGINFILNHIFLPIFGYQAAAYTTFVGYSVLMLIHYYACKRITKREIYNFRFETGSLLVICLLVFAASQMQNYVILRGGLAMVIGGTLVYKKKDILKGEM